MNTTRHEDIERTAAAWLARRDGTQWLPKDERELQAWLNEQAAHRVAWLRLQAAWLRADQMRALADLPDLPSDELPGGDARPQAQARTHRRSAMGAAAAVAGLAVGALLWFAARAPGSEERYSTPVGGLKAIALADGSRVTLNTRTRARAVVNERERKVWLDEGEAFFEVQPNPALPFVVTVGRDRITVLGTKFTVRYEAGRAQVTVLEGRVRLDRGDSGNSAEPVQQRVPTIVTHNDSAVMQGGGVLVMAKTTEQVQQALSWRQGRLVFDQMTLGEIAAEFNRYNRKQIVIEGEAAKLRLGGGFDAHNVDGFARLVNQGFGLKLETDEDHIRLSSN
jgi:transmembrane sensor